MNIASVKPANHAEFLALVDAEIRPDRAKSHAWDDFPLILSPQNAEWTLVATDSHGKVLAGIACLIRQHTTSCGNMPIAGIGSVVTHPDHRGKGLSTALQKALLEKLRGQNIPLAVLWTDQPEIYAGRGFAPAGWEFHINFKDAQWQDTAVPGFQKRLFKPSDADAAQKLFDLHALRTLREPGDADLLYNMPGTQGLVSVGPDDVPVAAIFASKGADFPDYILEWSGPVGLVIDLIAEAHRLSWANNILVPPSGDRLVTPMLGRGASVITHHSGHWAVLLPDPIGRYLQAAGIGAPHRRGDPQELLGTVDSNGNRSYGLVMAAIWGFDSV
ncbi:MAG: GNAT superfamily N-acetyltransferase [Candidatus Krumholzibacteriia bacterium]|jgi:GNAT superfamily N-acetyltransferase